LLNNLFVIIQWDVALMYHQFYYELQKQPSLFAQGG